ncbi:DUF3558 domain-containing protein [Skermania piniformis]|uniref:DUF3558 domain-containing protein n=2 Tax=Skermania pinensis TaxID=39122 RepID=A0ABX8SGU3_9ACTN|nr:DUF3558 domain-containing protein [Skermania piniformis]
MVVAAAGAVGLLAVSSGCGKTVTGTALPIGGSATGIGDDFRNLLTECDTVTEDQIAKVVGGEGIERGFFGAICRWDITGSSGNIKVTFNWFESGSLDVERQTLAKLKYEATDITVQGRKAIQERRPNDPDSCGVTVGALDTGIVGWWVQYRPGAHPDACEAASKLTDLTLNLSR